MLEELPTYCDAGNVSLTMTSATGAPVAASTTRPTIIPVRWPGWAPSVGMTCAEPEVIKDNMTKKGPIRRA